MFCCPLTLESTLQPVVTPCGHTFDRGALERRRQLGGEASAVCAVCGARLEHVDEECYALPVDAHRRAQAEAADAERLALRAGLSSASLVDTSAVSVEPSLLGRGSYGVVRRGAWRGRPVAVKQIAISECMAAGLRAELLALQALEHPHIVSLLGVCLPPGEAWLLLELAPHGSLEALLRAPPHAQLAALGAPDALPGATPAFYRLGAQLACALAYLHRRQLVHGNLKAPNVLLFGAGHAFVAKLADFGHSALAHTRAPHVAASAFRAPEVGGAGGRLCAPSDVFALAVLLAQCLSGALPFCAGGRSGEAIAAAVLAGERPVLPPSAPAELRRLLGRAWALRAADRPSAAAVQLELLALSGTPHALRTPSAAALPRVDEAAGEPGVGGGE